MNKEVIKDTIKTVIVIGMLIGIIIILFNISDYDYNNKLDAAKEMTNKQINNNTNFESKINIISTSCKFVFGNEEYITQCNKELLKIYK